MTFQTTLFIDGLAIRYDVYQGEDEVLFKPVEYLFQCIYPEILYKRKGKNWFLKTSIDDSLKDQVCSSTIAAIYFPWSLSKNSLTNWLITSSIYSTGI